MLLRCSGNEQNGRVLHSDAAALDHSPTTMFAIQQTSARHGGGTGSGSNQADNAAVGGLGVEASEENGGNTIGAPATADTGASLVAQDASVGTLNATAAGQRKVWRERNDKQHAHFATRRSV